LPRSFFNASEIISQSNFECFIGELAELAIEVGEKGMLNDIEEDGGMTSDVTR
jgi:hypothetical protein